MQYNIKYKNIILRAIIFLLIVYVLVPYIYQIASDNQKATNTYELASFVTYTIILVTFFGIKYRQDLKKNQLTKITTESLLFLLISITLFIGAYFASYTQSTFSPALFALSTILYISASWSLSVALFSLQFYKEKYMNLFFFTLLVYFFFMTTEILRQLWQNLSITTAQLSTLLLSRLYDNVSFIQTTSDPTLTVNTFRVIIGPACSGMESLSLFIGLFLMLIVYEGENINKKKAIIIFTLGLIGTYILNIIRVSLIMIVGQTHPQFAVGLFHSQIGWILFSLFILLLLFTSYKWMRINTKKQ